MSHSMVSKCKERNKQVQDGFYNDPFLWHNQTVVSSAKRFAILSRYSRILELCGLNNSGSCGRPLLNILEPGCGVGMFSVMLAALGEVWAFDFSGQGINAARRCFGKHAGINFFEADGEYPESIDVLKGKKFDFILLREFHPITRDMPNKRSSLNIVREYYNLLSEKGAIIIEYSLYPEQWVNEEDVFQIKAMAKEFRALEGNTLSLGIMLQCALFSKIKKIKFFFRMSFLLIPLEILLCRFWGRRLTKTVVISRRP